MSQTASPPLLPSNPRSARFLWWLLPLGCGALAVVVVGFVVGIFAFVMTLLKSSGAYENAMEVVEGHPAVIEATGEPIEVGFFVSGNVNVNGATGDADLSIPVTGPEGSGRVHVVATKEGGEWYFDLLTFSDAAGGPPIDLLEDL